MAAQAVSTVEGRFTSSGQPLKGRARVRAIETGDLVSNAPLRERCEWLMRYDPEFSLPLVCHRLVDLGYPKFLRPGSGTSGAKRTAETTHLQRLLGMADLASCVKHGRLYKPPHRTEFIQYEMAVALARALDMDPVDAGV